MNFYDLNKRNYSFYERNGIIYHNKMYFENNFYCINFSKDRNSYIILKDILSIPFFRKFPEHLNWLICCTKPGKLLLELGTYKQEINFSYMKGFPLYIPWNEFKNYENIDLKITVLLGEFDLLYTRSFSRKVYASKITGFGIEVGPGMNPQIKDNENTDVYYIERVDKKQWQEVMEREKSKWDGNQISWEKYLILDGTTLPFVDNSLDFIYSCHVFEHFLNPLETIKEWISKIKKTGQIVAVIPLRDANCDYRNEISTLDNLINMKLTYEERLIEIYGNKAQEYLNMNKVPHMHFYDENILGEFFNYCMKQNIISGYKIINRNNFKEITFILYK